MRVNAIIFLLCCSSAVVARGGESDEAAAQFFETRVRPVLAERCYSCHSASAKKLKGELYVDSRAGLLKGGESGPAVVPGHPEQSRLITAIDYGDPDLQMPPKGKLTPAQIADLGQWVKQGAAWPNAESTAPVTSAPAGGGFDLAKRKAAHWAWRPIQPQGPPAVKDATWAVSPIDRFLLAKLEEKGLRPAPPADRLTLLRRVYFDLTGLPPSPAEVQAFLDDPSPSAFEAVVDRLLASEHFGERWARHWMDVVRFAETRGHEFDYPIPNAWQYRDYLVRALNADVPYDQFVAEHLAGDLLDKPRLNPAKGFNESILGTAFWFLGEEIHSPVDIRQDEADRMNSRLDTVTKAFLGLTVGCARCHDHKFDAISAKDHYALTGVLLGSAYRQVPFESLEHNRAVAEKLQAMREGARPALSKAAAEACRPGVERATDYLLGARAVLVAKEGQPSSPSPDAMNQVARTRSLDAKMLSAWVDAVSEARHDPRHFLGAFATVALPAGQPTEVTLRPLLEGWKAQAEQAAHAPDQVIVDYTRPGAGWWQDGFTFGLGPIRAGEVELNGTAGRGPSLALVTVGSARRDPVWPTIRAVGSEKDMGALGEFGRPGRTFRTPKVTLKTGNVWFLMRGSAQIYAAVDSHLMINGPLHGSLLKHVKADQANEGRWRWVHDDLTPYAGQRMELEFTPQGEAGLEVAKVIEAAQPPATEAPNGRLTAALADSSVKSIESVAGAYQKLLADVRDLLAADGIVKLIDPSDAARIADWMLKNPDLFSRPDAPARASLASAVRAAQEQQAELVKQVRVESHTAPAILDGNGVDENVLVRGVAKNAGERVPRRFLEAIAGPNQSAYPNGASGRLELSRAMLAPENPFTSRVMVNRVWEHLFGAGIVPTVDNFGVLGQPPSHPELLDYLADEFRARQGWSVKKLIRSIVLSRAYQMSSRPDPATAQAAEQVDPRDLLLHHMPVRRLEAEAIRDSILAVSGRLDGKVGGPSVDVYVTAFMDGRGKPESGPLDGAGRRSLYIKIRRNFLPPMMLAFDMPIPFATVGRRSVSNVPAQALILMNDPFVIEQARAWAKRVLAGGRGAEQRITGMYLDAFARPPTSEELAEAKDFLAQMRTMYGLPSGTGEDDPRAWADFAHVLFNTKEFIFIQ